MDPWAAGPPARAIDAGSIQALGRSVACSIAARAREEGWLDALQATLGAARALLFPADHLALLRTPAWQNFTARHTVDGALPHLMHRHYLARGLRWRERVDCAIHHHTYDSRRLLPAGREAVYAGSGLELWREGAVADSHRILLRANGALPHEGALSVVLLCAEDTLCEMSYSWVPSGIFESPALDGPTLFVVRNQTVPQTAPLLLRFRERHPHHSPAYYCFAAVCGIARAYGVSQLVGILQERQIAYDAALASSFANSYHRFWAAMGATPLPRLGMLVSVPPGLRPLDEVPAKHRKRAASRRRAWGEIMAAARQRVLAQCRSGRDGRPALGNAMTLEMGGDGTGAAEP